MKKANGYCIKFDNNFYSREKLTEEHHSQEAVGAGSPKAFKLANRFYKPALPHFVCIEEKRFESPFQSAVKNSNPNHQ